MVNRFEVHTNFTPVCQGDGQKPARVRKVETEVAIQKGLSEEGLAARLIANRQRDRLDIQAYSQELPQQGATKHELIAWFPHAETLRAFTLVRAEQAGKLS